MRADYLARFGPQITGGFSRFRHQGALFNDAYQDHGITVTAPGHATLGSGVFPARHGIVGNSFFDRTTMQTVYCAADDGAPILGHPDEPGRSPRNLLWSGLGDWLKDARPRSKLFGVAVKDRGAIMPSGKSADGVYWYDYKTGQWVTSAYYREVYPDWVVRFNESNLIESYHGKQWVLLRDTTEYEISREDEFPPEANGGKTTFPHSIGPHTDTPTPPYYSGLRFTPFADELTLLFARELILNEGLATDDSPDLLFVGLSSADFIGHRYGPFSREIQDHFLRLDQYLGAFLTFLDKRVGADHYVAALSSDHGVSPLVEELVRRGVKAARTGPQELFQVVNEAIEEAMADSNIAARPDVRWVNGISSFAFRGTAPDRTSLAAFRRHVAWRLKEIEAIVDVVTHDDLMSVTMESESMRGRLRRSFYPDRADDLMFSYEKYHWWLPPISPAGHGSAYSDDMHVPLMLTGSGIRTGVHKAHVRTVDLAPTLATILGIQFPDDLDGMVLEEVLHSAR